MVFSDPNLREWGEAIDFEQLTCLKQSWHEAIPIEISKVKRMQNYHIVKLYSYNNFPNWVKENEFVCLGLKNEPETILIEGKIVYAKDELIVLRVNQREIKNILKQKTEYWLLPFSTVSYDLMRESILDISENKSLIAKRILLEGNISTNDINVIQGPPGTGKTTTIGKMCYELYNEFKPKLLNSLKEFNTIPRILLTAFTHKACVNIAQTLDKLSIPFIIVNVNNLSTNLSEKYAIDHVVIRAIKEAEKQYPSIDWLRYKTSFQRQILDRAMFIICTSMTAPRKFPVKQNPHFNLAIVDEGSQIPIPILAGVASLSEKLLVFGDPVQLPPVILSSLLGSKGNYKVNPLIYTIYNRIQKHKIELLDKQYRGRPEIFMLISSLFYEGKIRTGKFHYPLLDYPILEFIDTSHCKTKDYKRVNHHEIEIIQTILKELVTRKKAYSLQEKIKIGIISPFRAQANYLQKVLNSQSSEIELDCGTVHVTQGRTYDTLILSLAATTLSPFLNPPNSWVIQLKKSLKTILQNLMVEKENLLSLGYLNFQTKLEKVFSLWIKYLDSIEEVQFSNIDMPEKLIKLRLFEDAEMDFLFNPDPIKTLPENDYAPNIFNVALSRTKSRLIIIGNYSVLHQNPLINLIYSWISIFGKIGSCKELENTKINKSSGFNLSVLL